jgi:hypothetical protein
MSHVIPIGGRKSPRLYYPASLHKKQTRSLEASLPPPEPSFLAEMGRKFFVGGNWKCVIFSPLLPGTLIDYLVFFRFSIDRMESLGFYFYFTDRLGILRRP